MTPNPDNLRRGLTIISYHMAGEARAYIFPLDRANKKRIAEDLQALKECAAIIERRLKRMEKTTRPN